MAAALAAGFVTGCGTPGTPLPPSLKLPDPVNNLSAVRTGDQVSLAWTMPKRNTDKLLIKSNIPVRVCRKEGAGNCVAVPGNPSFAADAKASFTETLPAALASGSPRPLTYFVELMSPHGRSAGLSNGAHVLAGEAPAPVVGLADEVRKDGVILHWTANAPAPRGTVIRLHRKLVSSQSKPESPNDSRAQQGFLAPPKEQVDVTLLVEPPAEDRALDKTIHFGETYEYRAQRVSRIEVEGQTVELAGPLSDPIRVVAIDTFPPAIPSGLAAVATAPDSVSGPSIGLGWLPVTEADLAGYAVYRREGDGPWQRISQPQPVVGPGFHDPEVHAGHTYHYAVTAIDQLGHESARSQEAEETVPNP